MTPKAKRKRQKDRVATHAKVLEAARGTGMSGREKLLIYQWADHTMVHRVVKDQRSFFVNVQGANQWVTRTVWATVCGHVIAIELSKFLSTGRAPTCVRCIVGLEHARVGFIWPWDGSKPNVA